EKYYDEYDFADWTHSVSKVPMVKAQHPDYELFKSGIHSQRGLSCADCHMPYNAEGGLKFSNHHVSSPLKYISKTCVTCHRDGEEELQNNVYERQDKMKKSMDSAVELLFRSHVEAKAAWDNGATEKEMKPALELIRKAQWRCDFVAASHGASFHAPIESARILADSIRLSGEARLALAGILTKHNVAQPVALPDISTKAKAQKYIGLDMDAQNAKKAADLKKWASK
ncbi:MAG: ammonia-forming cytochrome c nitrite reductase subunit c552, partial [Planctomycetes bacterium]|nr:ammonia-forming cytochrome c nitrite reductase subunit c552 [Planctomycetota bacterium]